jgi:lipopolysaccharide export system protein LptC
MPSSDAHKSIADHWDASASTSLVGAERHSRFVFIMRLTLPILAMGIVTIVLIYSVAYKPNIQRVLDYRPVGLGTGAISMTNPRLTGLDVEDRYFVVTAREANRLPEDPERVTLIALDASVTEQEEAVLSLKAARGLVDSESNRVIFGPLVQIELPDGYSFQTDQTFVDMDNGIIEGRAPIHGIAPFGNLTADGFKVEKENNLVQLIGNVHLTIDMSHMTKSEKDSPDQALEKAPSDEE